MAKVIDTGITDEQEIIDILTKEGYFNIFKWCDEKDRIYPLHKHQYNEVRWIISGKLQIDEGDSSILLKAGDRMESKANTPHSAYARTDVCYICGSK